MICYLFPETKYFIFSSDVPALLYYAYIPTTVIALVVGFFVFWNDRHSLLNRLLFIISLLFSSWTISALIEWTNIHSDLILFVWNFQGIIFGLIAIFCIYFIYVFLHKEDIPARIKTIFIFLLAPIFISTPILYLKGFDITNCDAFEFSWRPLEIYYTLLGVLAMIWILVLFINKYRNANSDFKKQIIFMGIGIELFLSSFFIIIFLAAYLTQIGLLLDSRLEMYGLLGMVIFMIYISVLIVKFKAFNVKMIGAQALVIGLIVIIGSELFFVESDVNKILVGLTLSLAIGAGYMLIKSVKSEVQRKETLQKMSDKLAFTNDQLRKLDNAKSEFISIASHQLRTPLTAIKGFLSLLLEGSYGKLSSRHEDVLNKVYVSSERLINLVEDLLNISRIESGRMEFKFDNWNVVKMCDEVVDTFILRAKEKGLYLDYKKPERDFPQIETDISKLREVVSNIIDNALKYTQRGGVSVRLVNEENLVRIVVSDTGIGIPKDELPYLFSKFSRGKDTNRLSAGGTGLGLYVGKSIIESLGGKIWTESEGAGKGSKFIIELPKKQKEQKNFNKLQ